MMRVCVVMPARNEEAAVGLVLDEIPRALVERVVVVDNGSTDRTAEVARAHGAVVVSEPTPGYGRACLAGIAMAGDADVIVVLDADHSDYPEDLPRLLAPIELGEADLVIGSRVLGGGAQPGSLPWNQRFGNRLACQLMALLYGVRFTDMGPFRAIRRDALARLDMRDPTYGWNVEMQAKAVIAGLRTREVPVRYRRRIGTSKISGTVKGTIRAGTRIISTLLMYYPAYRRTRKRRSR